MTWLRETTAATTTTYVMEQAHPNPVEVARVKASVPPPSRMNSLNRFLLDDEVIRMSGLVSKRKGLFSKTRQECVNMMSKTSPLSVHALHSGTALECELSNMGYDVAAEFLFWKEENLALLEMSFPAMDRDILEEVLVETEFDLGAAVDVIRSRVDVINDMGVEVSLDDMLQHYGEHRRSAHEWVLIQDDWEIIDNMLATTTFQSATFETR
ncbi:hypothetical protein DYB32_007852 [Aphanomyces invadans]|uniref:CUE domain-containing protein n=1 Tax=Aphanomyces invadans TaxID=157072 RepID=A0A418AMS2_9STRA|nr:hypothetical protein DYB32_007852 [Aphanomyces invadans]